MENLFPEAVSEIPQSKKYNLSRWQMSSWAWAQERSIYSEKGQTSAVPGQRGVHAECLGNVSAMVCAFKLNSWPTLPAFFLLPFS